MITWPVITGQTQCRLPRFNLLTQCLCLCNLAKCGILTQLCWSKTKQAVFPQEPVGSDGFLGMKTIPMFSQEQSNSQHFEMQLFVILLFIGLSLVHPDASMSNDSLFVELKWLIFLLKINCVCALMHCRKNKTLVYFQTQNGCLTICLPSGL